MHLNPNLNFGPGLIDAIIIDQNVEHLDRLLCHIGQYCPQIRICGSATNLYEGLDLVHQELPRLIFMEITMPGLQQLKYTGPIFPPASHTIFTASSSGQAMEAFGYQAGGFLVKPIRQEALMIAVKHAEVQLKAAKLRLGQQAPTWRSRSGPPPGKLIGLPTIEGYEFIPIDHLIRCEGMQKYTQIITKARSDIISSQNIGQCAKLLNPYHFFAPHKSHLINLHHVQKYFKEGVIQMSDRSFVPVAKRRKTPFLHLMLLLR